MKYSQEFIIKTGDVDFKNRLKPSAMMLILQEVATVHANNLGVGHSDLSAKGYFWVLAQIIIKVERTPLLHEKILVETWPVKPKLINTEREFFVKDAEGNIIIRASSRWGLLEMQSHSLQRLTKEIIETFANATMFRALPDDINQKIEAVSGGEVMYSFSTKLSDLDINRHVNNTKYADYFFNAFTMEETENDIKLFNISYLNEMGCGVDYKVIRFNVDDGYVLELTGENDGKIYSRCLFKF